MNHDTAPGTETWVPQGLSHINAGDHIITVRPKNVINTQAVIALRDQIISDHNRAAKADTAASALEKMAPELLQFVMDFDVSQNWYDLVDEAKRLIAKATAEETK